MLSSNRPTYYYKYNKALHHLQTIKKSISKGNIVENALGQQIIKFVY